MINTSYSGTPYPAGKPAQATYSDEGSGIARKSADFYNQAFVPAIAGDALHLKNFAAIAQSPDTTPTEKLLAKLGKEIGETDSAKIRGALRTHVMNTIASRVPGPIGSVLATFCFDIEADSKIPRDSGSKAVEQSYNEIINSPDCSEKEKDLARAGLRLSKAVSGFSSAHIVNMVTLQYLDKQYNQPPVALISSLCSSISGVTDMPRGDKATVLNEGFDILQQHPAATPEEITLAQFGKGIKNRSLVANYAKETVANALSIGSANNLSDLIAVVMDKSIAYTRGNEADFRTILAKDGVTPQERDPWTYTDEIVKSGVEIISGDATNPDDKKLFGKLTAAVIDSEKIASPRARFYKGFLDEISRPSQEPLPNRIFDACSAAVKGAGDAGESREFLKACFKTLNDSDLPSEYKSIVEKGIEAGKTHGDPLEKVVERQLDVLKKLSLLEDKKELQSMLETTRMRQQESDSGTQPDGQASPAEIRHGDSEVHVDGVVLKKKRKSLSLISGIPYTDQP